MNRRDHAYSPSDWSRKAASGAAGSRTLLSAFQSYPRPRTQRAASDVRRDAAAAGPHNRWDAGDPSWGPTRPLRHSVADRRFVATSMVTQPLSVTPRGTLGAVTIGGVYGRPLDIPFGDARGRAVPPARRMRATVSRRVRTRASQRLRLLGLLALLVVVVLSLGLILPGQGAQRGTAEAMAPRPHTKTHVVPPVIHTPTPRATATATPSATVPSPPATLSVQVAQIFDYGITNPAAIGARVTFTWGANPPNVAAWRAANSNIIVSYYMPMALDNGPFNGNSGNPLSWWQQHHPSWVLYQCDGKTPAYVDSDPDVPLDLHNPAVLAWEMQTYVQPAAQAGYNALAVDLVQMENWGGACGTYQSGVWTKRYTGSPVDPQWQADVAAYLAALRTNAKPLGLRVVPNYAYGGLPLNSSGVLAGMQNSDAILDEAGFTSYGGGYVTDTAWVALQGFISQAHSDGKPYYTIDQFTGSITNADQLWAVANYLLSAAPGDALAITTVQGYGSFTSYPAENMALGTPQGAMQPYQGVYLRQYSDGVVIVNPDPDMSMDVHLPGNATCVDPWGSVVPSTVTLAPHSGLVCRYR